MSCLHRLRIGLCVLALASAGVGANEPEPPPETPATPIERPALPSRSATVAADLARQLPSTEVLNLQAADAPFVALWQPANVAEPKGLVILLPGEGESADWPRGIGPLRRNLPDHGWHTLSLSLPDSPEFIPPATPLATTEAPEPTEPTTADSEPSSDPNEAGYLPEETAASPDEAAAEQAAETRETDEATETDEAAREEAELPERIDERIAAALDHARNLQPKTIILLGQGSGAYWAARHLQQWAPDDVAGLALIQPRQPEDQQEPLAQLAPALKLAIGDFYYRDDPSALADARERLNASRRIGHPGYHQVGLTALAGERSIEQEQLVRRVRGWLERASDRTSR